MISKVESCDFGDTIGTADNWDRFNNNQYRDRLQSCDFIRAVGVAIIGTVEVADNWGRFDNN